MFVMRYNWENGWVETKLGVTDNTIVLLKSLHFLAQKQ